MTTETKRQGKVENERVFVDWLEAVTWYLSDMKNSQLTADFQRINEPSK